MPGAHGAPAAVTKVEHAWLQRVFAAEIDAALTGQPLRRLVQSKSKPAAALAAAGYLAVESLTLGGRFPVTVRGYVLTEAGRLAYCSDPRTQAGATEEP